MAEKYKTTKKRIPLRRKRCKLGVNKNTNKCLKTKRSKKNRKIEK